MYEEVDLQFSLDGDLCISGINDLQDTANDDYASLRQEIATRARAGNNSFALYQNLGANLKPLVGKSNNQETGTAVSERLKSTLTDGLIKSEDLNIEVFPLDATTLGALITVTPQGGSPEPMLSASVVFSLGTNIIPIV